MSPIVQHSGDSRTTRVHPGSACGLGGHIPRQSHSDQEKQSGCHWQRKGAVLALGCGGFVPTGWQARGVGGLRRGWPTAGHTSRGARKDEGGG